MSLFSGTMRKHSVKYCSLVLCILILSGFEVWRHFCPLPAHEWNTTNLKKIRVADPTNFYFAVFGDNRNSKSVFENLLKLIDHDRDIAFAIDLGDMVNSGSQTRYRFFLQQVRTNLAIPLLTGIGNHELRGKGRGLYHGIFGPFYYHFLKVHIKNGNMDIKVRQVPAPYYEHYGLLVSIAWIYMSDFLRFYGIQTVLLLIAGGLAMVIYREKS